MFNHGTTVDTRLLKLRHKVDFCCYLYILPHYYTCGMNKLIIYYWSVSFNLPLLSSKEGLQHMLHAQYVASFAARTVQ